MSEAASRFDRHLHGTAPANDQGAGPIEMKSAGIDTYYDRDMSAVIIRDLTDYCLPRRA